MVPIIAIYLLWLVWALSWIGGTRWFASRFIRASIGSEIGYRMLVVGGALLLFGFEPIPRYDMIYRFWPTLNGTPGWLMFALCLAGFIVAWWARVQLRHLRPANAQAIGNGPYALVRHPIYAALIVSSLATAAVLGTPWTLAGALAMAAGYVVKAMLEEHFLRSKLGEDAYDAYAKRVPMLVPFWPSQLWPSQNA
jgi:protein-S-isoprenylcysteine O-methyltransferase Ste14